MNFRTTGSGFIVRSAVASAVMTASQHLEMQVSQRKPSDLPVRVTEKLTGRTVPDGAARVATGHLLQGGLAALALIVARLTRHLAVAPAAAVNVLTLVIGDAALVSAVGLGDMPWRWRRHDLGIDVMHKTSLAIAARALTPPRCRPVQASPRGTDSGSQTRRRIAT